LSLENGAAYCRAGGIGLSRRESPEKQCPAQRAEAYATGAAAWNSATCDSIAFESPVMRSA
jgi:hypothetical protein